MRDDQILVVGAGIAGLAAAAELAAQGCAVTVIEQADTIGGKLREVEVGGVHVDSGPTVFTMRWVFDELFAALGASFDDYVTLTPADVLARHAWASGARLDLYADVERTVAAIGDFAGAAEAARYRTFRDQARRIYQSLERPFIRGTRPSLPTLLWRMAQENPRGLLTVNPYQSLWGSLSSTFRDERLRQLFGRYATYCGGSPWQTPGTLMLVSHVESEGVWLVEGGMRRIPVALHRLAERHGARFRTGTTVRSIEVRNGRACGVTLQSGERIEAQAIVVNADAGALPAGLFGDAVRSATAPIAPADRSLSALTWSMHARASGFPLARHTVFFSNDYAREFADIFRDRRLPAHPTVYVCAQDRDSGGYSPPRHSDAAERLFLIVNAPAVGDRTAFSPAEIEQCQESTFQILRDCGLVLGGLSNQPADQPADQRPCQQVITTPNDFHRLFPATGGALYGRAPHGWTASFRRPGSRSRVPGLYLAGGSTHPGPGVPMATLSGRMAAHALLADLTSHNRYHPGVTLGGISTP